MAKVIVKIKNNFTTIPNEILKNKEMSLKAKGLLITMLSLPEEWNYTIEGLCRILKEGRDSIRSALIELEENGYLTRERKRDELGKLSDMEYTVYQYPVLEEPALENPTLDNTTQLNTNILNKDILNNSAPEPHECDCTEEVIEKARDICEQELHLDDLTTKEVVKVISYYFEKYKQHTGHDHPNISKSVLYRIIETLVCPVDGYVDLIEQEAYSDLIDRHFATDYGQAIDYKLAHFAMPGIIEYQARNTGYFCGFKECEK